MPVTPSSPARMTLPLPVPKAGASSTRGSAADGASADRTLPALLDEKAAVEPPRVASFMVLVWSCKSPAFWRFWSLELDGIAAVLWANCAWMVEKPGPLVLAAAYRCLVR